ncbi:MAG TPA: Asp-tRNA(Asn)/Glu-tRNA(Gln) amidotransferase GatCAB subunit B, partial [Pirellulales bacterium]|nr:Asp-tRNA(Asn)/Glu-tRNA(Gln) amidotransferase GatCAB subunit B [Pirellulales bacterium]
AALGELLEKVTGGDVDTTRGREVFMSMLASGKSADAAMAEMGIKKVDESALIELCRELVAANPKLVADVKAGKLQAAGAFVGQAKKKNPNVNPGRVREICLELIQKM